MMIDIPVVLAALGIEFEEKNHEASALCPYALGAHW